MTLPVPAPVYYGRRVRTYLADLWSRRDFAWFLAIGNLKSRNASTVLGLFWWVLNPLLLALVYFVVFVLIIPSARDISYLVSGMFVFNFTSRSLTGGATSILSNSKLIVNVRFPRVILPISFLIESTIGFAVSLGVFYVIAIPTAGAFPGINTLLLLVVLPIHLVFNLGISCLAARLAVPFRDTQNVLPFMNRLWLYSSPVIWTPELMFARAPELMQTILQWNPLFSFIDVYRTALLDYPFHAFHLWRSSGWAALVGMLGVGLFVKYEGSMARYL